MCWAPTRRAAAWSSRRSRQASSPWTPHFASSTKRCDSFGLGCATSALDGPRGPWGVCSSSLIPRRHGGPSPAMTPCFVSHCHVEDSTCVGGFERPTVILPGSSSSRSADGQSPKLPDSVSTPVPSRIPLLSIPGAVAGCLGCCEWRNRHRVRLPVICGGRADSCWHRGSAGLVSGERAGAGVSVRCAVSPRRRHRPLRRRPRPRHAAPCLSASTAPS